MAVEFREGKHSEVFDEINRIFEAHAIDYCFDLSMDGPTCLLIFSPEGDYRVAEEIDSLLKSAPILADWKFVGRRQKKELSDLCAIIMHLYLVDLNECRFQIDNSETTTIKIFLPESADLTVEELQGLANTFAWHAFGEAKVMDMGIKSKAELGIARVRGLLSLQMMTGELKRIEASMN